MEKQMLKNETLLCLAAGQDDSNTTLKQGEKKAQQSG